jgi:glycine cleavage system H protein
VEYLIIIAFLSLLIPFWLVINKNNKIVTGFTRVFDTLTKRILNIPKGIYYSRNHTWAFLEESGNAKIGLNDFLATVIGNVEVKMIVSIGETISKGEVIAEIKQGDKHLIIASPLSGIVADTNAAISGHPELLLNDPCKEGWLCAVQPSQWKADTSSFLLADDAIRWILSEVDRFKDFLAVSLVRQSQEPALLSLQEGGEIRPHILEEMNSEIWEGFQKSFLKEL